MSEEWGLGSFDGFWSNPRGMIFSKMLSFGLFISRCYSSCFSMFFLLFSVPLLMKDLFPYIVPHYSIPSSTCLSSSMVLQFPLPSLQLFDFLEIKITFNTVQGSSPHKCGQESSCNAFNAVIAAFSQDISASLSLPYTLVIYPHLWNFLESGLKESRGTFHQRTSGPRRVFLSDQPSWVLTSSTASYNGPLWFLLLGRVIDENVVPEPTSWAQVLLPHNINFQQLKNKGKIKLKIIYNMYIPWKSTL